MKPSPFDDLLGDDETILWLAQARQQKDAAVVTALFLLFGCIFIAMAIWMFIEGPGDYASTNSMGMGILAPILAFSAGLLCVWVGVTGKGLLPPPTYAVSAKQAFMAENKPGGGLRRSIFLINREHPAKVTGSGKCCHVRIPVVRESRLGRTFVTFTYLTELDSEALLRTLAQASEPS